MSNTEKTPLLSVKKLSSGYGSIQVLHELSVEVFPGEIVSVIGANGAGKTTLLNSISGLVKISSGQVEYNGKDTTRLAAHEIVKLGLVQIPEGRKIFPRLTVQENLEMGAFIRTDREAIRGECEAMFELFPILRKRLAQLGGTLSGGEQQMLAIARGLMSKPKILLMDEPSMGVAPLVVAKIFETLTELNRRGLTVLLVEQNAQLALTLACRGYVLETGRVILCDAGKALLSNERVREAYLGE